MKVYVVTTEDNLPSEFSASVVGVYSTSQKAKDVIGMDYHDMIKECDRGNFIPNYFKEYTTVTYDGYWEIRSKADEAIYMSEAIEEFEIE